MSMVLARAHMRHIYDATCELLTYPLTSYGGMLQSPAEVLEYKDVVGNFTVNLHHRACQLRFFELREKGLLWYSL